jgi:hypothetical protein
MGAAVARAPDFGGDRSSGHGEVRGLAGVDAAIGCGQHPARGIRRVIRRGAGEQAGGGRMAMGR